MPSADLSLQSLPDDVLKRAIILSMAMNAGHPDFVDTTESGEIVWFDRDAKALFDVVLDEIGRRGTQRREPLDIDGFEAIDGKPHEVLMFTLEDWQDDEPEEIPESCLTMN